MSTKPIDYDALARQNGGNATVDYDALAKENGGYAQEQASLARPTATIGAVKEPTSLGGKIEQAYSDFGNDLKYGSNNTMVGRFLHRIGVQPTANGVSEGAADFMASPYMGVVQANKGVGQIMQSGKRYEGAKNVIGGIAQSATIPASFASPVEGEAAASGAGKVVGKVSDAIPSVERAGENFQGVMSKAKNAKIPITTELSNALSRYQDLVDAGGSRSMAVSKFLNRVTSPTKEPLTYGEARDFYSNISRLSADEFNRLTPVMKQQIGTIRVALNDALQRAAETVGKGAEYGSAMKEYAKASRMNEAVSNLKDFAKEELIKYPLRKLPWIALGYEASKAAQK